MTGTPSEVTEVHSAGVGGAGQALGEIERLGDDRYLRGRILAHLVEDCPLGSRRDDWSGEAFDPHPGALAVATLITTDRLERVDLVRPGVLAEAEEDHRRLSSHDDQYRRLKQCDRLDVHRHRDREDERFWARARVEPKATASDLAARIRALDERLRAAEAYVTSRAFRLRRQFDDLR